MPIKLIICDVGGVLITRNLAVSEDIQSELGLDDAQLKEFWDELYQKLRSGQMTETEVWAITRQRYDTKLVSEEDNLLGRAFKERLEINQPMVELLKQLRGQGYKLAVLSDTIPPHAKVVREAGIYDLFDKVFLSYETQHLKPTPQSFQDVLDSFQVQPNEAVFIDDKSEHVLPAINMGIKGITFTNVSELKTKLNELLT